MNDWTPDDLLAIGAAHQHVGRLFESVAMAEIAATDETRRLRYKLAADDLRRVDKQPPDVRSLLAPAVDVLRSRMGLDDQGAPSDRRVVAVLPTAAFERLEPIARDVAAVIAAHRPELAADDVMATAWGRMLAELRETETMAPHDLSTERTTE